MTATLTPRSPLDHRGHLPRTDRRVSLRVAAPPSGRRPAVAVHRRRRLAALVVVAALLLLTVSAAKAAFDWLGAEATAGASSPAPAVVVAEPGDTYWGLAADLDRGGDLRSTVDALVAANGGRELRPGDRIVLPA